MVGLLAARMDAWIVGLRLVDGRTTLLQSGKPLVDGRFVFCAPRPAGGPLRSMSPGPRYARTSSFTSAPGATHRPWRKRLARTGRSRRRGHDTERRSQSEAQPQTTAVAGIAVDRFAVAVCIRGTLGVGHPELTWANDGQEK